MPGQFLSPDGDLESAFVSDPAIIDQFAKTGSLWGWVSPTILSITPVCFISSYTPIKILKGLAFQNRNVCI